MHRAIPTATADKEELYLLELQALEKLMKLKEVEPRENRLKPDAQCKGAGQDLNNAFHPAQSPNFRRTRVVP